MNKGFLVGGLGAAVLLILTVARDRADEQTPVPDLRTESPTPNDYQPPRLATIPQDGPTLAIPNDDVRLPRDIEVLWAPAVGLGYPRGAWKLVLDSDPGEAGSSSVTFRDDGTLLKQDVMPMGIPATPRPPC